MSTNLVQVQLIGIVEVCENALDKDKKPKSDRWNLRVRSPHSVMEGYRIDPTEKIDVRVAIVSSVALPVGARGLFVLAAGVSYEALQLTVISFTPEAKK